MIRKFQILTRNENLITDRYLELLQFPWKYNYSLKLHHLKKIFYFFFQVLF